MKLNIGIVLLVLFASCKGTSQEKEIVPENKVEQKKEFAVQKSNAEWKKELTDAQYYVLREEATENPFTSELLKNKKEGTYICAACATPLFKSNTKFDSGTGWPSFYEEIEGNVAYDVDYKIGYKRTEEHGEEIKKLLTDKAYEEHTIETKKPKKAKKTIKKK